MAPVLGYWDIRGLGEPIRYLLHYVGAEFEDKRYLFGEGDDLMDGEWKPVKYSLDLELPNLPYYIDGDVKLTQSAVILRYLGKKHGLYYPEEFSHDALRMDMIDGHIRDLFFFLTFSVINSDGEKVKDIISSRVQGKLEELSNFMGTNEYILGDKISHVDFLLFEVLDFWRIYNPDVWKSYENLRKFQERFAGLPKIQAYRQTSRKWPLFGPVLSWGGGGEPPSHI